MAIVLVLNIRSSYVFLRQTFVKLSPTQVPYSGEYLKPQDLRLARSNAISDRSFSCLIDYRTHASREVIVCNSQTLRQVPLISEQQTRRKPPLFSLATFL